MSMNPHDHIKVKWIDGGREPKNAPDPRYPSGIDLDLSNGAALVCSVLVPYPAPRCGAYLVICDRCDTRQVVTTAGRPDDPRSITIACKRRSH